MSTGSGAIGTPTLNGYSVNWDVTTGQWVATSNTSDTVLRGRDQDELDAARWRLVMSLADELQQICRYAASHGYTPPPRNAGEHPSADSSSSD